MTLSPDELTRLERSFWLSGESFYEDHLAETAVMIFPGFGILSREEVLTALREGPRWEMVEFDQLYTSITENAAVITYYAAAAREGDDYTTYASSTYLNIDGQYRLVLHQQTVG